MIAGLLPALAQALNIDLSAGGQSVTAFSLAYAVGAPVMAMLERRACWHSRLPASALPICSQLSRRRERASLARFFSADVRLIKREPTNEIATHERIRTTRPLYERSVRVDDAVARVLPIHVLGAHG